MKQSGGTHVGNSFTTTKDKDGKIRVKPISGFGLTFRQKLAKKAKAKKKKATPA